MVKRKRQRLVSMMTNKFIWIITLFVFSLASAQKKIIANFNNDTIKDTLFFNFNDIENSKGQPYCKVEIITGKLNKKYNFNLYYVGFPIIDNCGDGCISLFDSTKDTEYTQEYTFCPKYDTWILSKDETYDRIRDEIVQDNLPKDYYLSIDEKKYKKE